MEKYDVIINSQDQSYAKVIADFNIIQEMYDYFSFHVEGYQFNPKYKYGGWDGKIRLMGLNGDLPFGLIEQVQKFTDSMQYSLYISPDVLPKPVMTRPQFDEWLNSKTIYSGDKVITPHWYQSDAVFEGLNHRRRILNLPTSAGKSLIQSLLAKWYCENKSDKILVIVPTTALVYQMINDFVDYRLFTNSECHGILAGTAKDSNARIYVSTWQSAVKQPKSWFNQFGMLLTDECHLATGKSIGDIIKKLDQCPWKIGLSGSLRDGKANLLQYIGLFGKVFKPVSTKQLMDEGQISDLKINAMFLEYTPEERKAVKELTYQQEIDWLLTHKKRNQLIIKLALKLSKERGETTVIMFKSLKHGKLLYDALKKLHDKVHYISGETDTDERVALKAVAEADSGLIIIASYGVFSTGISIKRMHNVIYGHPTKSKITVLQSIGRILRLHGTKTIATLYDLIDNLSISNTRKNAKKEYSHVNFTMKHGILRIERYIQEQFNYQIAKVPMGG